MRSKYIRAVSIYPQITPIPLIALRNLCNLWLSAKLRRSAWLDRESYKQRWSMRRRNPFS